MHRTALPVIVLLALLPGGAAAQGWVPAVNPPADDFGLPDLTLPDLPGAVPPLTNSLTPGLGDTTQGLTPGLPDDAFLAPVICITPDGYCEIDAAEPVASGSPCYCDGSTRPGVTE